MALCHAMNRGARSSGEHLHDVTYCGLLIWQQFFMRRRQWLLTEAWCFSSLSSWKVKSSFCWAQAKTVFWALFLSIFDFCNLLQPAEATCSAPSHFLTAFLLLPTARPALSYPSPYLHAQTLPHFLHLFIFRVFKCSEKQWIGDPVSTHDICIKWW